MPPADVKRDLRERMRRVRAAIPPEERTLRAERVAERVRALPEVERARTVLLFYSFGSEVATSGMASGLLESGKRVLLPFLEEDRMEGAEVPAGEEPVASDYGPKEPRNRTPVDPAEVDVVVAPGLAFDRSGRRLGYGGGHYDRYLARLRPDALRIGICFSSQVVPEVPSEPEDESVHLVVSDEEVIDCRSAGDPSV